MKLTYEQIAEPDQHYWHPEGLIIEVDQEEGVGKDSETDGVQEEGEMTEGKAAV